MAVALLAVALTVSGQAISTTVAGRPMPARPSAAVHLRLADDSDSDDNDSGGDDSGDNGSDDNSGNTGGDNSGSGDVQQTTSLSRAGTADRGGQPIALILRKGKLADDGDAEDLGKMLSMSPKYHFKITYVGPKFTPLTADLLNKAALFAEPGGEVETETAKKDFRDEIPLVQRWVTNGGRFLGVCAGGFVAGKEGYDVFPGEVGSYIDSKGALVKGEADKAIPINWRGQTRRVDFQDGNYFKIPQGTRGVTVFGTYNNGLVAAAVATHGGGKAGFIGPHLESRTSDDGVPTPNRDQFFQLVDSLMSPPRTP